MPQQNCPWFPPDLPTENVLVPPLDSAAYPHANPKHWLYSLSFHRVIIFKYFSVFKIFQEFLFWLTWYKYGQEAEKIDNILVFIAPCPPLVASHTNYSSKALITYLDWHDLTVLVVRCTHFSWVTLKHHPATISPPHTACLIDQKHLIKKWKMSP